MDSTAPLQTETPERLRDALDGPDASARLQVALAAGTRPNPAYVEILVERCAIEPDFYVRDMLTWALTRHPAALTVPLLLNELQTGQSQARSQALHSLSKIGDPRAWSAITPDLLRDADDEVARSAWRAAVFLAPDGEHAQLARILATQLGRGDRDLQLSLSRAFVGLGEAGDSSLEAAANDGTENARLHAVATQHLVRNPDDGFDASIFEAKRTLALMDAPIAPPADIDVEEAD
jgi:HEAT repeat protein